MREFLEKAFVEPMRELGIQVSAVLPGLVRVVVVLLAGALFAWIIRQIVWRMLRVVQFDKLAERMGLAHTIERTRMFRSPSDFGARMAQGFVWLVVILSALTAAGTEVTRQLVVRFVNYLPDLITAALVILLGAAVSKFLARSALLAAVNAQWAGARIMAGGVRILVMTLAVVIALEQLRIGRSALLVAFGILFAGIVIAAAIAFGFGARDLARQWMEKQAGHREPEDEEVFRHL
jgi:hypothetical protein